MDRIREHFTESIQTKIAAAEVLSDDIQTAAQMLTICLLNGNKILTCGHGPAAALSQLFVSQLVHRYDTERPALPAFSLNADGVLAMRIEYSERRSDGSWFAAWTKPELPAAVRVSLTIMDPLRPNEQISRKTVFPIWVN